MGKILRGGVHVTNDWKMLRHLQIKPNETRCKPKSYAAVLYFYLLQLLVVNTGSIKSLFIAQTV